MPYVPRICWLSAGVRAVHRSRPRIIRRWWVRAAPAPPRCVPDGPTEGRENRPVDLACGIAIRRRGPDLAGRLWTASERLTWVSALDFGLARSSLTPNQP